ncbi:MAG: 50S ribosomal protein L2 [Candidatus Diapherotrites archaeon]|nr:50S ribosomal protein L2 [Candidatus Diapherotrites archaeon]
MAKRITSQRMGKGSPAFWNRRKNAYTAKYHSIQDLKDTPVVRGEVVEFIKESGRSPIVAKVALENGNIQYGLAAEGQVLGQQVWLGAAEEVDIGNVLFLKNIPEGCPIFNIEKSSGDGGKFVRASGEFAIIVIKEDTTAKVKMPSGKTMNLPLNARATIGCVCGGERVDKPFVKAGAKFYFKKTHMKLWPRTRGVANNASSHPFGGAQHHVGKSKSVSRHAPPGRKVGNIASRRTGRKKGS